MRVMYLQREHFIPTQKAWWPGSHGNVTSAIFFSDERAVGELFISSRSSSHRWSRVPGLGGSACWFSAQLKEGWRMWLWLGPCSVTRTKCSLPLQEVDTPENTPGRIYRDASAGLLRMQRLFLRRDLLINGQTCWHLITPKNFPNPSSRRSALGCCISRKGRSCPTQSGQTIWGLLAAHLLYF